MMSQSRVLYPNNHRHRSVVSTDSNVGAILYPGTKVDVSSQRTTPQFSPRQPTQELNPNSNGALQFLPAFSKSNKSHLNNKEASWDALLDNPTVEEKKSENSLVSSLTARAQQTKQRRPTPQRRNSNAPSNNDAAPPGRIARLALLFGNRTTVEEKRTTSPTTSSSSGHVGWPGTQDSRGRVKSYDDSSNPSEVSDVVVSTRNSSPEPVRSYTTTSDTQKIAPSQLAPRNNKPHASPVSSTTSSAYMNENELLAISSFDPQSQPTFFSPFPIEHGTSRPDWTDPFANHHPAQSLFPSTQSIAPTKELLEANHRMEPPVRTFPGYLGLIDKTHEVPCLADQMEESETSSKATTAVSSAWRKTADVETDVFDGVAEEFDLSTESPFFRKQFPISIAEEVEESNDFSIISLGGGLTAIQTSADGFLNRKTASDYDDQLTNSDIDHNGFAHVPSFHEMMAKGRKATDSSLHGIQGNFNSTPRTITPSRSAAEISRFSSDEESSLFTNPYANEVDYIGDLSEYYIPPNSMKKLVRRYRRLSQQAEQTASLAEFERVDDENKAFALFEMRSRIMEKDIERGLERRGGTTVCDDIVTTPYHRKGLRVRDACIVSKAWRDGVVPTDIRNAAVLTRRAESTYFIRRPIASVRSMSSRRYTWEPVNWVDETDFMQYRCPSLGGRHMRGFEMFTIGDCQSILLKLTNEQCEVCRIIVMLGLFCALSICC
jgi:hypothetical protein